MATLNADLPALRPAELGRVLAAARRFPRAFLADAADIGTTFLSAAPGIELRPAFGGASRLRHLSSGAAEIRLGGVASVRQDVDTAADLRTALTLGVGPRTAALHRADPPGGGGRGPRVPASGTGRAAGGAVPSGTRPGHPPTGGAVPGAGGAHATGPSTAGGQAAG